MANFHKRSIKIMFSLLFVLLLIVTLMLVFKKDTWPPEDLSSNTPESPFGGSGGSNSGNIKLIFTLDFVNGQPTPSIITKCTDVIIDGSVTCNEVTTLDGELFVIPGRNGASISITPQAILNEYFLN